MADQEAEPGKGSVAWGQGTPGHGGSRWVWCPSDRTLRPTASKYGIVSRQTGA
ncbi:hypothetical protein FOCG_10946 [Fusarium oxysporum f. sp. radicis-lycopersici 26381]|uniref:Uncharacterized protein n=3 Tax=Fusarium oxysporum TaxID=5507 RepID=A0A0J9VC09_FUSO4|nr:hypothetical protein FOXG_20045 [Fusarium oxysporum f. sp. lycopersici 4287]EWZ34911.1 hypothetical protein FOZG_12719 [Fusarium oxysporum Fo47]EWZ94993.1 hypothetical protein FOWG_05067 [Fusarium oxysporum f. sp. lycopersici MN25]EXK37558.1 hypothetical protein FOMG_08253 [Fusarium oxysporum f. sp. melonis 26406]EXL48628.1 hypothetical protein FOCG_10946 [Fusarium oxysporum f. sp. radicis-lycopersici 26381]KNB08610.1 hypothetical protein FOXG_20045 [Fusarium oxysporum f. sp. lycopersici 42